MTIDEHNRTLGILHLVYGGLHLLGMLLFGLILMPMLLMDGTSGMNSDAAPGEAFLAAIFLIRGIFALIFSIPSFVAGIGMLKRKSWAKIWSMIAGGLAGMSFPIGTALCVYTFWFLFSGGGNQLYDEVSSIKSAGRPGVLHGAPEPANWQARNRDADYVNAHRSGPPDWRGE